MSFANRSAGNSSSLGIVFLWTCATLVFEVMKFTDVLLLVETLRQTTAAYAPDEASQNPIKLHLLSSLELSAKRQHCMLIVIGWNSETSNFHFFHFSGSSQSTLPEHSS
jgi:hypothetical protein